MPISKFIGELMEDHLTAAGTGAARRDLEQKILVLEDKNKQLRSENTQLSRQVERLNKLMDQYEEHLQQLKNKQFLDNGKFNGIRKYEQKLIELLKEHKNIKEHDILDMLHVSPSDVDTMKAISKQLELLLDYGIIKMYKGGYQWQG